MTTTTAPRRLNRRLTSLALAATLLTGSAAATIATAGAAAAAEPTTVHDAQGNAVDALGGVHGNGFDAANNYNAQQHVVWIAAGERFTESHHDSCNPYTFMYGGVETDPHCPIGQVKSDWNVDFVKDVWQQSGIRTYTIDNHDLSTFWNEGVYTSYYHHVDTPQYDYVPQGGDAIFWGVKGGADHTVGLVLEATSATHVKVVIADHQDKLVTKWIDPSCFTVKGEHVTGYVTPTYNG